MISEIIKKTSVTVLMLVFFILRGYSSPGVYTYHIPGEDSISVSAETGLIGLGDLKRNDKYSLGLGVSSSVAASISFEVLHKKAVSPPGGTAGDTVFELLWSPVFKYNDCLYGAFLLRFNLPTGPDLYESEEWSGQAFGNNDITLGPVLSFFASKTFLISGNILYTMREGPDESFYSGGRADLDESDTYRDLFGLNPFVSDTFLSAERLKNDFLSLSISFIKQIKRFALAGEIYYSFHPYRGHDIDRNIPLEGAGVEPLWLKCRAKFIPAPFAEMSLWYSRNMLKAEGYPDFETGFNISFLF